jgi:thymidylate synthase (FAD)
MEVKLKWITPDADKMIAHMARVSNPSASPDDPADRLIAYLLKHKHFSPFEMACACVEIVTTRDIARQILRHRSFHFQEFSQRYAEVDEEPEIGKFVRLQDHKNRQNSIPSEDHEINEAWVWWQNRVWDFCWTGYKACLKVGIAKELARKLLPEGLTRTHMYMQGTLRDWLHYIDIRQGKETQLEHQQIAYAICGLLEEHCPVVMQAAQACGITVAFCGVE